MSGTRSSRPGYPFDSLGLRAPDPAGTLLAEIPDARTGGPDLPATVGLPRPALARIMADRAAAAGAKLRLGTTRQLAVAGRRRRGRACSPMARPDGTTWSIGADGIRSATRRMIGITDEPRPTGMGILRAFGPRPASVTRTDLYYGGPCYIAGYCPTGENSLYAYLVEDAQDRSALTPAERLAAMRDASRGLPRPLGRDPRDADRPRNGQLHPVRGAGRARAVEPGAGRADRRRRARLPADPGPGRRRRPSRTRPCSPSCCFPRPTLDDALWAAFTARRFERAKTVVEASCQLGQWQLDHEQGDVPGLMATIAALVSQPA